MKTRERVLNLMRINKAGLPDKKVKGLFCFGAGLNIDVFLFGST